MKVLRDKTIFDPDVVDKLFGGKAQKGSIELFSNCCIRMLSHLDDRMDGLKKSLDRRTLQETIFFSHQLKGGFYMTGSSLLGALCESMEMQARRGTFEGIEAMYVEMVSKVCEFKEQLAQFDASIGKWLQNWESEKMEKG